MYIPDYDEFLIYTTKEEILNFVESLIRNGINSTEEVLEKSVNHFGGDFYEIIKYIILNDEYI
jgi:hypothetical protein